MEGILDDFLRRCNEIVGRGREKIILQRMGREYEYPLWNEWSAFVPGSDADGIPPETETVRLDIRDSAYLHLLRRPNLRCLVASGLTDALVPRLIRAHSIEQLSLQDSRVSDLSFLAAFPNLSHLHLDENTRLTDLGSLASAKGIRTLVLHGVRHVHELHPLSSLPGLIGLSIGEGGSGSVPIPARFSTLAPLARLHLRALRLGLVRIDDDDLAPIVDHPRLEVLEIGERYPVEQLAAVAARYGHLRSRWRTPRPGWGICRLCGKPQVVMAGRRRRQVCAYCHPDRVVTWQRRFDEQVARETHAFIDRSVHRSHRRTFSAC